MGTNTLRICAAYGPTVCASCVKDDSIEIIKRSDYGVLKTVENNSFLRAQRKSTQDSVYYNTPDNSSVEGIFCTCSIVDLYTQFLSFLSVSYLSNGTVCVR